MWQAVAMFICYFLLLTGISRLRLFSAVALVTKAFSIIHCTDVSMMMDVSFASQGYMVYVVSERCATTIKMLFAYRLVI